MAIVRKRPVIRFDSVIFATDFSPASQNAGLYASAFSRHFGAILVVAHGFILTQAALDLETEKPDSSQLRADLNRDLLRTAEALAAGPGTAEIALLEGDTRQVIPAMAQRRSPALVAMGTHGRGAIDRFVFGSTAEGILRRLSEPALTVGPSVKLLNPGALKIERILYATDCSIKAAYAAPFAIALADAFEADLDVLNVVQPNELDHADEFHRAPQGSYPAFESMMPQYAGQVCVPQLFVRTGQPHKEVLKHINERRIDLLVLGLERNAHLGVHSRTSGAFVIILEAQCPVITVTSGSSSSISWLPAENGGEDSAKYGALA
jgi:nucleotide-binding universal stress UspA family protein